MMTNKVEVSAKSGMHFKFYSDDVEVTYYCSPVSGKEVVKVNGEIVSEAQNFKFSSTHQFEINGNPAKIRLKAHGLTKNVTLCEFFVADELVKAYKLTYGTKGKVPLMAQLVISVIAAAVGWFFAAQFLSSWLAFAIMIALLGLAVFKFEKPSRECEEV